jgi:hypothetical protein
VSVVGVVGEVGVVGRGEEEAGRGGRAGEEGGGERGEGGAWGEEGRTCARARVRACVHAPFDLPPTASRQLRVRNKKYMSRAWPFLTT